ncbi:MAG: AraC family transcriptional regulator [Sulfuriflexus sp.]|nr:AraC family transcriptional regulator [Sulfuriflexus sp.]
MSLYTRDMEIISIFNIGFSIIIAITLCVSYLFFIKHVNKGWMTLCSCVGLLGGLALAQYHHYYFYTAGVDPLSTVDYRLLILFLPPMFYFFSRAILFPELSVKLYHLLHFLPLPLAFIAPREVTVPTAFLIGTGYCLWLTNIAYNLRGVRKRFGLVFIFFTFFTVVAIFVLILGFAATYIDVAYFYHFYTTGIGLSLILVTGTLIVFPNVLSEIDEVVRLGYSNSTLANLDVEACKQALNEYLTASKMYQNENLSLALLAGAMNISPHQLSELINSQYDMGFSQYIRLQRIEAAKQLLKTEADASVLSISMEVGFKSQSNFYAAFKEITGESPGNYRKTVLN